MKSDLSILKVNSLNFMENFKLAKYMFSIFRCEKNYVIWHLAVCIFVHFLLIILIFNEQASE